jgi:signal transduction histidine kinase
MGARRKQKLPTQHLSHFLLYKFIFQLNLCDGHDMDTQEAKIYAAVVITTIIIGCIIAYFFIAIIRQQRYNLLLQKQNLTAEISAMERERRRIAADLHDEIGAYLSMAKLKISHLEPDDEQDMDHHEIMKLIENSLKRIREISFDLMPASLLRNGLPSAIKEYISFVTRTVPIDIALVGDAGKDIADWKSIHIYRMIQEMIQNAIKHSGASEILIVFEQQPGLVRLKLADNGIGLDSEMSSINSPGIGLRSLQNRAELIGGQLFIQTSKGKGISYILEMAT